MLRGLIQPLLCMQDEVKEAKKAVKAREKKVFELPGQTKDTPAEVCGLQTSLSALAGRR